VPRRDTVTTVPRRATVTAATNDATAAGNFLSPQRANDATATGSTPLPLSERDATAGGSTAPVGYNDAFTTMIHLADETLQGK
jgi:hypothetical protein